MNEIGNNMHLIFLVCTFQAEANLNASWMTVFAYLSVVPLAS